MDFRELLNVADYNKAEAKSEASIKRYTTVLAPPKKLPKSGVQSDGIAKFLAKKKAEEERRIVEERKKKEQLLALRAQSTKNSKKAKIMASRTKDNDFSKIKLSEDEILAKKSREAELMRKNLADKVERMKARIELEEKEKLLPKTRKRKKKDTENEVHPDRQVSDEFRNSKSSDRLSNPERELNNVQSNRKPLPKPSAPKLSFHELLKVAEKKQYEPVELIVKKKEEEKLMTKKERKLKLEEQERMRRKQELLERGIEPSTRSRPVDSNKSNNTQKKLPQRSDDKCTKKPLVIHVENASVKSAKGSSKLKIPGNNSERSKINQNKMPEQLSSGTNTNISNHMPKKIDVNPMHRMEKSIPKQVKRDESCNSQRDIDIRKKELSQKNRVPKTNAASPASSNMNEDALVAAIEKRIREKIEKEMEEKLITKFGLGAKKADKESVSLAQKHNKSAENFKKPQPLANKNNEKRDNYDSVKRAEKERIMKRDTMPVKKPVPFHTNPYLDPPRRLLEPQRPRKPPPKRRVESDDDDDDDMSDFIDDGACQNDEDYSKYIKEIFGYDRNRYIDDDDDDIVESSFAEQMKEEVHSAKLGFLEDLEEERKEREEMKRKKKKLK